MGLNEYSYMYLTWGLEVMISLITLLITPSYQVP